MGWGFRKSIRLGKGVRLNVSKRGLGVSAGVKGFRVGTGPTGTRVRATLPGTGLYYEKRLSPAAGKAKPLAAPNSCSNRATAAEVTEFEELLHTIANIHTVPVEAIDWTALANAARPFPEGAIGPNEHQATEKLHAFTPSLLDQLFSRTAAKITNLESEAQDARELDQQLIADWRKKTEHAKRVLRREGSALLEALQTAAPYQHLLRLGSQVSAHAEENNGSLSIEFHVHARTVIPDVTKTLTKTGKVSVRRLGITKYYELLLAYVTGGAIAIAKESFAVLPVDSIVVHCIDAEVNPATGLEEERVYLSVSFDRATLESIVFENIEPAETVKLFPHTMKFLKTKGFQPVSRLESE